jgi:hypothetical protein
MRSDSPNWRDPALDPARLAEPVYFAERLAAYQAMGPGGSWYVNTHTHTCPSCRRVITHTGLEATREGAAAHICCGQDVRGLV